MTAWHLLETTIIGVVREDDREGSVSSSLEYPVLSLDSLVTSLTSPFLAISHLEISQLSTRNISVLVNLPSLPAVSDVKRSIL